MKKRKWPITMVLDEGKLFVDIVLDEYRGIIEKGDEIISINGNQITRLYENPDLLIETFDKKNKMTLVLQDYQNNTRQVEIEKIKK